MKKLIAAAVVAVVAGGVALSGRVEARPAPVEHADKVDLALVEARIDERLREMLVQSLARRGLTPAPDPR